MQVQDAQAAARQAEVSRSDAMAAAFELTESALLDIPVAAPEEASQQNLPRWLGNAAYVEPAVRSSSTVVHSSDCAHIYDDS